MKRFNEIEVGEQVTVIDFRGVWTGKVVAKKETGTIGRRHSVIVEHSEGFTNVEDCSNLFSDQREAWLHKGRKLQEEASRRLAEAASAFAKAGVPSDEAEASEE